MTNAEKVIGKDAVAALRAAGMIVVAHDAIRLAQAHAVAIEQERVRQLAERERGRLRGLQRERMVA